MALKFDGSGKYVRRTANLPTSTAFTVLGWYDYIGTTGTWSYFLELGDAVASAAAGYALGFRNTGVMEMGSSGGSASFGATPSVGSKFAFAMVCSAAGAGNLTGYWRAHDSTTWNTAAAAGVSFTTAVLHVGNDSYDEFSNAGIWNVKVWDRALSAAELMVESYYARPIFRSSLNLHWPLRNASDTKDYSGNGRDATVGGSLTSADTTWQPWASGGKILSHLPATPAPLIEVSDVGQTRNRPGRGPYSVGLYFRPSIEALTRAPQIINDSLVETGAATDSLSSGLTAIASISEAGAASDSVSAVLQAIGVLSEAGAAADSVSSQLVAVVTLSEAGSGTDAVSAIATLAAVLSESGSATDAVTGTVGASTYNVSLSEAGSGADSVSSTLQAAAALLESGNASDAIAALLSALTQLQEIGAASDVLTSQWSGFTSLAEVAAAIDSISTDGQLFPGKRIVVIRAQSTVKASATPRSVQLKQ